MAGAFLTQGFVFISLTTRLPAFSDLWSLSEVELSLLLLGLVLLAGVGTLIAERVAPRFGSALPLRAALLGTAVTVPVATLAPNVAVFAVAVACYGVTLGVIDAAINMQAVALEHEYARPILPSFHGAWTVGGLIASALTLATADLDLRWMACLAIVPLVAATAPYLAHERAGAPSVDVVRRALAPDHAGRGGARALLHGRHGGVHLGTDVPRPGGRRARPTWSPWPRSPTC